MVYKWSDGSRFRGDAAVIGQRLNALREQNGGMVTAEQIVDDARKKSSPLHGLFEWSDKAAAHEYRLHTARVLIASIVIVPEDRPKLGHVRAFVNVRDSGGRAYTSLSTAMSTPELRQQVLAHAKREAKEWRRRYAAYSELAAIHLAIDETVGAA